MNLPLFVSSELSVIFPFLRGLYHIALQYSILSLIAQEPLCFSLLLVYHHTVHDVYMTLFHTC